MAFFVVLTLLLLGSTAAVTWLKSARHAAYALIASVLATAGMLAWLQAEFMALALVLVLASGAALLLMIGLPLLARLGPLTAQRPDEDRSFWAGIVAVLFFVITYRMLATTSWGLDDHSRIALAATQRGLEAVRTLGETFTGEFALAILGGLLLCAAAIASAAALTPPETSCHGFAGKHPPVVPPVSPTAMQNTEVGLRPSKDSARGDNKRPE